MAKINEEIFRTYDIRGIYPNEINEEVAYKIARAFAAYLKASTIPVAYDMRESSQPLAQKIFEGLVDSGIKAIDIGMMPTPVLNFAVAEKKFKGGLMVTASHNPKEYNGIKLIGEKAVMFSQEKGINKIKEI